MPGTLLDFDPLRIVEFDQLQLRRCEHRGVQRRMTDLAQALLALIVCAAIPCDERLPIFDMQLPFVNPYGHALPRQPWLRIDIKASLLLDSRVICDEQLNERTKQRFASLADVVHKLKETQV